MWGNLVFYLNKNLVHNSVFYCFQRKLINFVAWLLAIVVGYTIVYGPYKTYKNPPTFFTDGEEMLYGTFFRFVWSLCVAWVIFACHNNDGGKVLRGRSRGTSNNGVGKQ